MLRSNSYGSLYALLACAALLGACEQTTKVGSGCMDGVCPKALTSQADACLLTVQEASFDFELLPDEIVSSVCHDWELELSEEGLTEARVYYVIDEGAEPFVACSDRAFLKPVHDYLSDRLREYHPNAEVCELSQLGVAQTDGGEPSVAEGDGFYYDDFSEDFERDCSDFKARIAFTRGAVVWPGVSMHIVASQLQNQDGENDPQLVCDPRTGSEPVGSACLPGDRRVYNGEVIIETRSESCGDGVCLAHHLDGDIDASCDASDPRPCVAGELSSSVFCTCRCDGPPGTEDLCECPTGFSCVDVVHDPDSALAGSYCVAGGDGNPPQEPLPTDEAMRQP